MARSDSQIDKPQHGRPEKAELPDVNIILTRAPKALILREVLWNSKWCHLDLLTAYFKMFERPALALKFVLSQAQRNELNNEINDVLRQVWGNGAIWSSGSGANLGLRTNQYGMGMKANLSLYAFIDSSQHRIMPTFKRAGYLTTYEHCSNSIFHDFNTTRVFVKQTIRMIQNNYN